MNIKEILLSAAVLAISLSAMASAQMDHEPGDHMSHKMMQMEQSATHDQKARVDHFEVLETRLQEKMATMEAAKGKEKIAAMQDVIEELVVQRRAMHREMMNTMPKMMEHMSKHMSMMEGMEGMEDMMASCPMMKMHSAENAADGEDHSAHH